VRNEKNQKVRFIVLAGIILCAAFSRLIPHPPNFTPLIAIALFGGAYFGKKSIAVIVPLAAMLISDVLIMKFVYTDTNTVLGHFANLSTFVTYFSFVLIVGIGFLLRGKTNASNIAFSSLGGALLFFVLVNFAVWAGNGHNLYPKTMAGLIACYTAAIPFFKHTLISTAVYSTALFGSFELAKQKFSVLSQDLSYAK